MLVVYILFLLFCILISNSNTEQKSIVLAIACIVLAYGIGYRELTWSDTSVYQLGFVKFTPTIFDYSIIILNFSQTFKHFFIFWLAIS